MAIDKPIPGLYTADLEKFIGWVKTLQLREVFSAGLVFEDVLVFAEADESLVFAPLLYSSSEKEKSFCSLNEADKPNPVNVVYTIRNVFEFGGSEHNAVVVVQWFCS